MPVYVRLMSVCIPVPSSVRHSIYLFHLSVAPFISFICLSLHSLLHLSVTPSISIICSSLYPSPSSGRQSIHLLHLSITPFISFTCPSLHPSPSSVRHPIYLLHLSITPSISFICPSLHVSLLRCIMSGTSESVMVAYTHKYTKV